MSTMALNFLRIFEAFWVSLCPKNLQSVDLNCILLGLSDRLFILAVLGRVNRLPSC